jgi:hypothetical protein
VIYLGAILVFGLFYFIFVKKWGWETGSIVMGAFLLALAIMSGAIGFLF